MNWNPNAIAFWAMAGAIGYLVAGGDGIAAGIAISIGISILVSILW